MLQKLEEEASEHKTRFVARMHARSRAREGERLDVAVGTRELHFFDRETGAGIYALVDRFRASRASIGARGGSGELRLGEEAVTPAARSVR